MPIRKTLSSCCLLFGLLFLSTVCSAQGSGSGSPPLLGGSGGGKYSNSIVGTNGIQHSNINAVHAFLKLQESADTAYAHQHYARAHKLYTKLATHGDKFSQYRLAIMNYYGHGVSRNVTTAYAWSYVAAESGAKAYIKQLKNIETNLSDYQLELARSKAVQYLKNYGLYALAHKAQSVIRQQRKKCTGSRVGASCDRISSVGKTCNAYENNLSTNACLTLGAVGIPSISGLQPLEIRSVETSLNTIMREYGPSTIEFRDFHVINDDEE